MKRELAAKGKPATPEKHEMPIPERFRVARGDGDVRVSWRWLEAKHFYSLFFVIAWDAFLIFWYTQAVPTGELLAIVFPIAHVAVGVGMTYSTLSGFLNRTTLRAHDGTLRIEHGPLPWRGNATLNRDEIRQLYVFTHTTTDSDNDTSTTYQLCALLANGRERKLVKGLREQNEAAYLEDMLENALGIANASVPGETRISRAS
ncbi:MAG TPA: hypothetical protein VMZ53_04110 [Kofleriaceae bacterium]|nr:hypothetical protein [Kofleriaceae bacterium]